MTKLNLNDVYSSELSRNKKKHVQNVQEEIKIDFLADIPGYGHTQGKKNGKKLKRLNIQLTPKNHEYIKTIAAENGITISKFINYLINKEIENVQNVQDVTDLYKVQDTVNRRINMGFSDDNYKWIMKCSKQMNISPSSYINQLILNIQKNNR